MVRRLLAVLVSMVAALGFSTQVLALDCHNISRNVSPAEQAFATSQTPFLAFPIGVDPQTSKTVFWNVMPMFKGNWYLLALTEGAPEPVGATIDIWWGWIAPGHPRDRVGCLRIRTLETNQFRFAEPWDGAQGSADAVLTILPCGICFNRLLSELICALYNGGDLCSPRDYRTGQSNGVIGSTPTREGGSPATRHPPVVER